MNGGDENEENREDMNPVEMLNQLACCLTCARLMASQVAVLTTIARYPSLTSGKIVNVTGMSLQNVGRILNYLVDVGDLTFIRDKPKGKEYRSLPRHFYVTAQGMRTIRKMMQHLSWGGVNRFRIVKDMEGGEVNGLGTVGSPFTA